MAATLYFKLGDKCNIHNEKKVIGGTATASVVQGTCSVMSVNGVSGSMFQIDEDNAAESKEMVVKVDTTGASGTQTVRLTYKNQLDKEKYADLSFELDAVCVWKPWIEVESGWSGDTEYGKGTITIKPITDVHFSAAANPHSINVEVSNIAVSYDNKQSWNTSGTTNLDESIPLNSSIDLYVWDKNNKLPTVNPDFGVIIKFNLSIEFAINVLGGSSVSNMYYRVAPDSSSYGSITITYDRGTGEWTEDSHDLTGSVSGDTVFYRSNNVTYYIKFNTLPNSLDDGGTFSIPFKIVLNSSNIWGSV